MVWLPYNSFSMLGVPQIRGATQGNFDYGLKK